MKRARLSKRLIAFLQNAAKVLLTIIMCYLAVALGQCCQQINPLTRPTTTPIPRPTATIAPTEMPEITGNLVDLLEAGLIEAQPRGSSIDELELDLRRLLEDLIEVEIEVGTYFAAHSGSVQNMVVVQEVVVRLDHDGWIEVLLDVACGNMSRDIPGDTDTFEIVRSSEQAELQMLVNSMAMSDREGYEYRSFDVLQAAIWIITDDASYSGLGILVRTGGYTGLRTRAIDQDDTARAMQLVDDAGIDITTKTIWDDREIIADGVDAPELAEWIRARAEAVE